MQPAQCNTEVYLQNSPFHGFLFKGSKIKQFSIIYQRIIFSKICLGTGNRKLFFVQYVVGINILVDTTPSDQRKIQAQDVCCAREGAFHPKSPQIRQNTETLLISLAYFFLSFKTHPPYYNQLVPFHSQYYRQRESTIGMV